MINSIEFAIGYDRSIKHLQLKQEALDQSPAATLDFFSCSWLANIDEMNDLWCSSTVGLLSTQIWMG